MPATTRLSSLHQTATGRESGVAVELKLWQLTDIKDGHLICARNYLTAAEALGCLSRVFAETASKAPRGLRRMYCR